MLIADEVYQANIYVDNKDFFSFKKVACDMGLLQDVPLVSLHSISKGRFAIKVQCGFTPVIRPSHTFTLSHLSFLQALSGNVVGEGGTWR